MNTTNGMRKAEYRSPAIVSAGDAAELTLGNGTVYPDSLGDPSTSYGKYREAEALEAVTPEPAMRAAAAEMQSTAVNG